MEHEKNNEKVKEIDKQKINSDDEDNEKHLDGLSEDEKNMIRLIADIFVSSLL